VILWTPNTEDGEYDDAGVKMCHRPLAYWLDYVRSVAGAESPILIVQGWCDTPEDKREVSVPLPVDFAFLQCLVFSARKDKDDAKLNALRTALKGAAAVILDRHKASKLPASRIELAQTLRDILEKNKTLPFRERTRVLTQRRFRQLCKDNGKITRTWREALQFLHLRGTLFWRPNLFEGRIILDQSWALKAIYAVFDRRRSLPLLYGDGHFTRQQLAESVWKNRSQNMQRTFLSLMESCGICFRFWKPLPDQYPNEWEYIAPELLPVWSSREIQRHWLSLPEAPLRAEVHFDFLHEGILRTFLSWLGSHIGDKALYWRFGCRFEDKERNVLVVIDSNWDKDPQYPWQGVITLKAWDAKSVPLLEQLIAKLEALSPVQKPEVNRIGFDERGLAGGKQDEELFPDAIASGIEHRERGAALREPGKLEANYPEVHQRLVMLLDRFHSVRARRWLVYFHALVKARSYSKAAPALRRDITTVRGNVAALQQELGVALVSSPEDEGRKRVVLTSLGVALADWIERHPERLI